MKETSSGNHLVIKTWELFHLPLTGRMEHEPILMSIPNFPHLPRHVCINEANAQIHVSETIKANQRRR